MGILRIHQPSGLELFIHRLLSLASKYKDFYVQWKSDFSEIEFNRVSREQSLTVLAAQSNTDERLTVIFSTKFDHNFANREWLQPSATAWA